MLVLRSFINLFIVPVIAFYYFLRKNVVLKKGFENLPLWFRMLVQYCIILAMNIPITRAFSFALRIATGLNVEADSSYYTIIAIIAAIVMPEIYDCIPKIIERMEKSKRDVDEDVEEQ